MPCYQSNNVPSGYGKIGTGGFATEADCLNACKEGACCNGTTCSVKPQCQCDAAAGEVFKGIGTVCSPNPCIILCPCCDEGPAPPFIAADVTVEFRDMLTRVTQKADGSFEEEFGTFSISQQVSLGRRNPCGVDSDNLNAYGFVQQLIPDPYQPGLSVFLFISPSGAGVCTMSAVVLCQIFWEQQFIFEATGAVTSTTQRSQAMQFQQELVLDAQGWAPVQFSKVPAGSVCAPPSASWSGVHASFPTTGNNIGSAFASLSTANPLP